MNDILDLMLFNIRTTAAQLEAAGTASVGLLKTLMVMKEASEQRITEGQIRATCKLAGLSEDKITSLLVIASDHDEEKPLV